MSVGGLNPPTHQPTKVALHTPSPTLMQQPLLGAQPADTLSMPLHAPPAPASGPATHPTGRAAPLAAAPARHPGTPPPPPLRLRQPRSQTDRKRWAPACAVSRPGPAQHHHQCHGRAGRGHPYGCRRWAPTPGCQRGPSPGTTHQIPPGSPPVWQGEEWCGGRVVCASVRAWWGCGRWDGGEGWGWE